MSDRGCLPRGCLPGGVHLPHGQTDTRENNLSVTTVADNNNIGGVHLKFYYVGLPLNM